MPKKAFMYLFERTTQAKVLQLGLYVPWVGFYKSDVGIKNWQKLAFFAGVILIDYLPDPLTLFADLRCSYRCRTA